MPNSPYHCSTPTNISKRTKLNQICQGSNPFKPNTGVSEVRMLSRIPINVGFTLIIPPSIIISDLRNPTINSLNNKTRPPKPNLFWRVSLLQRQRNCNYYDRSSIAKGGTLQLLQPLQYCRERERGREKPAYYDRSSIAEREKL